MHRQVVLILISIVFPLTVTAVGQVRLPSIRGVIALKPGGRPARNVVVTVIEANRSSLANEQGKLQINDLSLGEYHVVAHLDHVPEVIKTITVGAGESTLNLELTLTPVSEQVTVTTTGSPEAVSASFEPVTTLSSIELGPRNPVSIGEALEGQLGVAKRSFGPGSGRPVSRALYRNHLHS